MKPPGRSEAGELCFLPKNVVSCICEQSFCIFSTGVQLYTATTAVGLFNTTVIVSRLYADRY